ncbi:cytochrome ubiquinol oxidase subunit II [Marivivens donghaensis]|uniref:Cytochrome ubiquinol oxidase subunit II n=1 Tax=Marivivens donghaensis TaxID=1699413 RepID=A0ABX0VTG1_9RHOB|nr:cytochrome ubiquinol oxidase subunit II [Marivivens donghaensis]NIY71286.1 cytochrome ubiquinol oxidase subunit II [Marivivens donghaensis]
MKRLLPLFLLVLLFGGCEGRSSFLSPQGPIAAAQSQHFWYVVTVMMVVCLPVFIGVPWIILRYRYKHGRGDYSPRWHFSKPLEILVWGVPVLVVIALGIKLAHATMTLDPYKPLAGDAVEIQVIGYDWKWLFIYPEQGIATVGDLVFPADRPVSFRITSDTVMQSFFIPALGSQIYAMKGMETRLNLAATGVGEFLGENSQYSGDGFATQSFAVHAVSEEDFATWAESGKADGMPFDRTALEALQAQSTRSELLDTLGVSGESVVFTDAPPDLFTSVATDPSRMGAMQ